MNKSTLANMSLRYDINPSLKKYVFFAIKKGGGRRGGKTEREEKKENKTNRQNLKKYFLQYCIKNLNSVK